jgi:hypothetical protein
MKTSNVIILVGVLGVGGVGAYMYMKNKQAQNALLTGSLPATNQGGATTPSATTPSGTSPLSTTSDGVSPSDANLNLANATVLVGDRKRIVSATKASCLGSVGSSIPSGGGFGHSIFSSGASSASCYASRELAKKQLVELDAKLAKLGYKVDATGSLVKV